LRQAKRWEEADTYYQTILSWYPGSTFKDRAYAGLGLMAQQQGKRKKALEWFVRFEKENSQSPLLAEVLEKRADLYLEDGQYEEAIQELERILEVPSAKGKCWVQALYRIGEIKMKQKNPKRAIPYFQRIYVMYGKWTDYVARAYWQSGQAFEQLEMKKEAVNTYKEFLGQEHLEATPEYSRARERLKQVNGV
jgi:tetratricopeptide (TPR) repeat protein